MFIVHRRTKLGTEYYEGVQSHFYFTFGSYIDKKKMGIGPLRAVNIDRIEPHHGFDMHQHRDMEIITYQLKGRTTHQDELGNNVTLETGGVHVMSTGVGLKHSEFNETEDVAESVQIWIEPNEKSTPPTFQMINFKDEERLNRVIKVASHANRDGVFKIKQDIDVFILELDEEHYKPFKLYGNSVLFIVQLEGESYMNGKEIHPKDAVEATTDVHIQPITHSKFIILEIHD